jgi:hypothetical protein
MSRDLWKRGIGVGAYSKSGPTLKRPGEIPHQSSSGKGVGPYASSSLKMDHPNELATSGVTQPMNKSRMPGGREVNVDTGANPLGTGGAGRLPKR